MARLQPDCALAVILGGGVGSRLRPLTLHRSKPAVPLAGKYRLIDIPISNSLNSRIERIFVLTQFNSASLNRHISTTYRFDQFSGGFVQIIAAEQTPGSLEWFQGTADAVRQSLLHVLTFKHTHVLILSGDQLYLMDYRNLLRHHEETKADITVAAIPVTAEEAPALGILQTDTDLRITHFYEKPSPDELAGKESALGEPFASTGRNYLASMGIYLFSTEVLQEALRANPDAIDFGKQILPAALANSRVVAYPFDGYWSDIGTIRSFYEANLALTYPKPAFDLYAEGMPIYTNARMLPPAKIHHSQVDNALIAEASVILHARVVDSVIGVRSYIGARAVVERTIMMGSDYLRWHAETSQAPVHGPVDPGIGEDSVVLGAIIDKNVSIGRRCRITNRDSVTEGEGPGFVIRDGIIVIEKNARIDDDTVI